MQIFFSDLNPYRAAMHIPEGRQARMIQEACQMICKGMNFEPFQRKNHPNQGKDLSDQLYNNYCYRNWVLYYTSALVRLRRRRPGADIVLTGAEELLNKFYYGDERSLEKVPVRLPKEFTKVTGYSPRSLEKPEIAIQIYRELLTFKYGVSFESNNTNASV